LIASGHPPATVWDYTIRQAVAFSRLANIRENHRKADELSIMTLASRGEPRDVSERHKELTRDI
jgi:hypothetical protein